MILITRLTFQSMHKHIIKIFKKFNEIINPWTAFYDVVCVDVSIKLVSLVDIWMDKLETFKSVKRKMHN